MNGYLHYSFDLWLTLIKSNPLFKNERSKYFFKYYNTYNKSLEEVELAFRQVDLLCNAINEKTGGNIDAEEMYLMVINKINNDSISFNDVDLTKLYHEMDNLLFQYMPVVYCEATYNVLCKLKARRDITFNILSNTGFIKGASLRKVLEKINLSDLFEFQIYSDEVGMSKPNQQLFNYLLKKVNNLKKDNIESKSVIHVGDNPVADFKGAKKLGIASFLINSNNVSISSLLN